MKSGPRCAFCDRQLALDAPEEDLAWVVFSESLEMRVETVTVKINVEARPITLRTNLYVSAVNLRSQGKNCVVRDQSFPFQNL
jgi:hypothetical protein